MTFASPELMLGLLLVPVAIGLYLLVQRRRSRAAVRFTNVDLLANIAHRIPAWRRHVPPVLYLVAITALVIGLARPSMVMAVPREEATIVLAIDVSRSMRATDGRSRAGWGLSCSPPRRASPSRRRPTGLRSMRRSTTSRPTVAPPWATRASCRPTRRGSDRR